MSWLKNYARVKGSDLMATVMSGLVSVDLEGATEADLMTYEQNLDRLVIEAAKQKTEAERERKEAVAIVALYNQKMAAIELLQADVATSADPATLNAVIEEEISALEAMLPDIEREKQEADEAEADLKEMQELAAASAKALKSARANLEAAKKNLERQKRAVEREEIKVNRAKELKGLVSNVGKLSTALDIMNKQAEEAKIKADGLKMKGDLLGANDDAKNDLMKNAMAKAAGTPVAATVSIQDRFAALKKAV